MGLWNKVTQLFRSEEETIGEVDRDGNDFISYSDERHTKNDQTSEVRTTHSGKVKTINYTTQMQIVLFKPERFENNFDEMKEIADYIKSRITVVLNLEKANKEQSRRILDFMSGVAYGNNARPSKIAVSTFIISQNEVVGGDTIEELVNNSDLF